MKHIHNPYGQLTGGQWFRGNLHTHTTRSDGNWPPQAVIDEYARKGYDFLMLSDHDQLTNPTEFDSRGMVMIPGNEISASGPHLLHVDARSVVPPNADRQRAIDTALGDRGMVIVNHPNWYDTFDHCSIAQLKEWNGYCGMEIYNGVIGWLDGSPYATNKWDMLLKTGRQVWGFANDDCHRSPEQVGLGWNVAYAQQRSAQAILDSLRQGRFYASTGVTISDIRVEENRIRIESTDAQRIVALRQTGCRFKVVDGPVIEVEVPDEATYVRFECWGAGERFAWTQPFFIS